MKHFTQVFKQLFTLVLLGVAFQATSQVTTFSYTGAVQTYTVPAGVTSIQIECWGAQGGTGVGFDAVEGTGGLGGYAVGELTVTPGQVLQVFVGGAGASSGPGGFNGGGQAGTDYGAAGGGASDVRTGAYGLADRVIVGGGGGGGAFGSYGSPGGAGGGLTGGAGTDGPSFTGGGGGTQVAGGAAGCCYGGSSAGTFGFGAGPGDYHNAGGGGGWYGGGSGAGHAGAGGGSSYIDGVISGSTTTGIRTGNGQVVITELCENMTVTVSDTEVCTGEEITLTATSPSGATVTWDGGVTNGVAFAPPVGTTTYTATSTNPDECEFSVDITVYALPTVTASVDDSEICLGESATFTGGGASTYSWDMGVTDGTAFTPATTGTETYTVTGTDVNGCENTATVDLTVNALPTVTASADDTEVCDGETVTLTGGGADSYAWTGGVTDGVAFTPAVGTTTYTVTGTNATTGCENTASIDITVNALPTVTASVDDSEICLGESATFSGGGASTYSWDMGVTDGVAFTPASAGTETYTVTGTDANGCENTATVDLTVNALPTVTASVDDSEICLGESATFTGGGASTYSWDMGVTNGVAFTPASAGTETYTVTGTDANGCENTATVNLTVNTLPTVTASADDSEVCDGDMVTLTGGGADSYSWTGGVTDGVAFTPALGTTTYTVTGTNTTTGCENTASIDITVNALPTVTASASETSICFGESVTFTGGGALTYSWDMGVTDGVAFTPATSGTETYTVTGTDVNGCENTATVDVTVASEIVITYTTVDEVFGGDGAIDITVSGGVPGYSFDWDNDGTGDFDDTEDLTGLTAGFYTVVVQDASGCETEETIEVILACTPLDVTVSDYTVCETELLTLDATSLSGAEITWDAGVIDGEAFYPAATGTVTYTATSADGSDCPLEVDIEVLPAPVVNPTIGGEVFCDGDTIVFAVGGDADTYVWDSEDFTPEIGVTTYTVTGTYAATGCARSSSIDVTVHPLPTITASIDKDEICVDGEVVLTGGGAVSYDWTPSEIIDGEKYSPANEGTFEYSVIGTDANGCKNTASVGLTVLPTVNITGVVTGSIAGDDGTIDITVTGGISPYTYDWDNDGTGDFDDTEDLSGLSSGMYTVIVKDSDVCGDTAVFILSSQLGVGEDETQLISVYPNPVLDQATITLDGEFNYSLYTVDGKIVLNGTGIDQKLISLDEMESGTYLLVVTNDDSFQQSIRLIKQ